MAKELKADILLIDEKQGRKIATREGISITGLLGILIRSKQKGLILAIQPILDRLIHKVGFHIHPNLYHKVMVSVGEMTD